MKCVICMSVLPGEPTDGSGRVCIHLFLKDEAGPIVEPHVLHPVVGEDGQPVKQQVVAKATRGRLACGKRLVAPVTRGNTVTITQRTDDPRAATCLKCLSSREYLAAMAKLGEQ